MPAGRPRKPAAQRAREGGTAKSGAVSHRPQPATELVAVAGRNVPVEAPADLPEPARELWGELVRALAEVGILDRIDLPAMRELCIAYGRAPQARLVIDAAVDEEEHAALESQIRDTETLLGALKGQVANMLRAGLDVPPAKVNAIATYEGTLVNLRAYASARRLVGNMVALGSTGQLIEHPLLATERHAQAMFLRGAGRFGITPADRAGLGVLVVTGKRGQAELDDVIGKRAGRKDDK